MKRRTDGPMDRWTGTAKGTRKIARCALLVLRSIGPPLVSPPVLRSSVATRRQHEAHAAPRLDAHGCAGIGELLPDPRHVDVHHVGARVEVHVPDALQQL